MPGLAVLAVAIFAAVGTGMFKKVKNQKKVTGTVVSLEFEHTTGSTNHHYAWVEYEIDGNFYVVKSKNKSRSFYVGQKFKVAYNQDNPNESFIKPTVSDYIIVMLIVVYAIYVTIQSI